MYKNKYSINEPQDQILIQYLNLIYSDMDQIQETLENIKENLTHLEQFINRSPLFTTDNKKWRAQITSQEKQIKKQIRIVEEEINDPTSPQRTRYVGSVKSYKKKLQSLKTQVDKRQRGDSLFGTAKTTIIQTPQQKRQNAVQELFRKGDQAQSNTKNAITQMVKITQKGVQISNQINLELTAQIQQIDRMKDKVKDTQSTLKKAQKNITYFAKALQCDKCMVGLLILILLALVAVIVLAVKNSQK